MDIRGYPPPEDPALDLPMPDAPPLHATFGTAGDVPFDDLMLVDGEDVGQLQAHRGEVAAAWGNGSGKSSPLRTRLWAIWTPYSGSIRPSSLQKLTGLNRTQAP